MTEVNSFALGGLIVNLPQRLGHYPTRTVESERSLACEPSA